MTILGLKYVVIITSNVFTINNSFVDCTPYHL